MNSGKIALLSSHFSGAIKLSYLLNNGIKIDSIITVSAKQANDHDVSGYYDFHQLAEENGLDLYEVNRFDLKSPEDVQFFQDKGYDILLVSGWQRLVPDNILSTLAIGAVAEHGSAEYLPRGRGRSPINWSIIQNRKRFVLHIFFADAGADSGKIIDKEVIQINDNDDIYSVYSKISLSSGKLFKKNIPNLLNGTWTPLKEALIEPTYFPKRTEKDDLICWDQSTLDIYNKVRASTKPYPGAKSRINGGENITIWKAQPYDFHMDDFSNDFGEILEIFPDSSFVVKTGDGNLLIREYECYGTINRGDILQ
ncbi:methionyl-tRNA formyltransferase [Candidatus Latescibacterota bacterium]